MEGETIRTIRLAMKHGKLPREFKPRQVNEALGIDWAGVFLPKHREGNPGRQTEFFVRIGRGLYRLNN